jgi:hypothetical protein
LRGNYTSTPFLVLGTLSTANNSQSDADMTAFTGIRASVSTTATAVATVARNKVYTMAAKTSLYLNCETELANTTIGWRGVYSPTIIRAECVYL